MIQKSVDERFSSHVCIPSGPYCFLDSRLCIENEEDFCHFWIGAKDPDEFYGVFHVSVGHKEKAHRYALARKLGRPIKKGMKVDHSCHNSSGCRCYPCFHHCCVRESHLLEKTNQRNILDGNSGRHPESPQVAARMVAQAAEAVEAKVTPTLKVTLTPESPEMQALRAEEPPYPYDIPKKVYAQQEIDGYYADVSAHKRWEKRVEDQRVMDEEKARPPPPPPSPKKKPELEEAFEVYDEDKGDYIHKVKREGDRSHVLCPLPTCQKALIRLCVQVSPRIAWVTLEEYSRDRRLAPHIHSYPHEEWMRVKRMQSDPQIDRAWHDLYYNANPLPGWDKGLKDGESVSAVEEEEGRTADADDDEALARLEAGARPEKVVVPVVYRSNLGSVMGKEPYGVHDRQAYKRGYYHDTAAREAAANPSSYGRRPPAIAESSESWMRRLSGRVMGKEQSARDDCAHLIDRAVSHFDLPVAVRMDAVSIMQRMYAKVQEAKDETEEVSREKRSMTANEHVPTRAAIVIYSLVQACRTSKVARVRVMDITGFFSDMGHVVDVSRALRIGYDYGDDAPSVSVRPLKAEDRLGGIESALSEKIRQRGGSSLKLIVVSRALLVLVPSIDWGSTTSTVRAAVVFYAASWMSVHPSPPRRWGKRLLSQREVAEAAGLSEYAVTEKFDLVVKPRWDELVRGVAPLLKGPEKAKTEDVEILPPQEERLV